MKDIVVDEQPGFYHVIEADVDGYKMSEDAARWPIPLEWDNLNSDWRWWEVPGDGASQQRMTGFSAILLTEEDSSSVTHDAC